MRKAKTTQKITYLAPDVQTKVVPAPVDGWDAISPLAEMDPKRAPILNNWGTILFELVGAPREREYRVAIPSFY